MKILYKEFCSHITSTIDLTTSRDNCAEVMAVEYARQTGKNKTASTINYFRNDSGMFHAVRDLLEKMQTEGDFNLIVQKFQLLYPAFHPDWQSALRTGLVITAEKLVNNTLGMPYVYNDPLAVEVRCAGLNCLQTVIDKIMSEAATSQPVKELREICQYIQQEQKLPLPY